MDDIRRSLSRFKKGVKHRLTGSNRKADKSATSGLVEGSDTSGLVLQPDAGVVTDGGHEGAGANEENVGQSAVVGQSGSDWKATTSASAKLLLRGVRDSADAFGPLKSVAGGLCFFLDNYEVWLAP